MKNRIAALTKVVVHRYEDRHDEVTVVWKDRDGSIGATCGLERNRHITELLRRAWREHTPTEFREEAA